MKFLAVFFAFLQGILDRIPTKQEAIANEIDEIKGKLHDMQQVKTKWTVLDTATYYKLADRLSELEKRSKNAKL